MRAAVLSFIALIALLFILLNPLKVEGLIQDWISSVTHLGQTVEHVQRQRAGDGAPGSKPTASDISKSSAHLRSFGQQQTTTQP